MKKILVAFVLFFFAAITLVLADDSLVAAAKKEKERRAKIGKPARVITNQDVEDFIAKGGTTAGTIEVTTATGEGSGGGTMDTGSQNPPTGKTENAWKNGTREIQQKIADAQEKVKKLEGQANSNAYNVGVNQLTGTAANQSSDLDNARQELEAAKQQMEQLQEDAHKEGVPPGWVDNQ